MPTILITGCSSGYGLETARLFHARGWSVVATMRRPDPALLPASDRLRLVALDVGEPASIAAAVAEAGPIDVLVNNAGIGLFGAAEATPMATVREVFETNTFGVIAMCRAVIPAMRARGAGRIVNVTSSATLAPMPLVSVYTASKAAVEGYTASVEHELRAVGLRVKLVEPGYGPGTRFTANGQQRMAGLVPPAYAAFAQTMLGSLAKVTAFTQPQDVAEAVWEAVHDDSARLRHAAGADAVALAGGPACGH
ncbi:SDR family oxidoreductase [Piscinibacter sakaiensis]|uniref:Dehydrogenase with different specificities n=1 Tax=Piscinibacter sakaiensis TaxID=1547922 RepID=A0A0K8P5J8_PISS1|nr:SDR family oxidoreductase [Piscinibacter sakaiensis]GAP37983.1 dehydrogenase with different specificities [Piscinibacter sakaiensis]